LKYLVLSLICVTVILSQADTRSQGTVGNENIEIDSSRASTYRPTHLDSLLVSWDSTLVDSFFAVWKDSSLPLDTNVLLASDDTTRAIYDLFQAIFELNPSDDTAHRYLVLQDSIEFVVLDSGQYDSVWSTRGYDRIEAGEFGTVRTIPFRPRVPSAKPVLYLTNMFTRALNYYFVEGDGSDPCIHHEIDETQWKILRISEQILQPYIPLTAQHWCIGFVYCSYPQADLITFSRDLKRAKVSLTLFSSGGEDSEYSKTDKGWVKVRDFRSWIE
jgi:hypothetical protein